MKVKDNLWPTRGRPRKFKPGETVEWRLRAPDNLLMELRISARAKQRSLNDEIMIRLMISLRYQPSRSVISSAKGERLIALARKFEEWVDAEYPYISESQNPNNVNHDIEEKLYTWKDGKRIFIPGKASGYSMRIPENLADEIRITARLQKRSLNDEMLTRLMDSLGYFSDCFFNQTEDFQTLKVLALMFERYLLEKISEAEKENLPWEDKGK